MDQNQAIEFATELAFKSLVRNARAQGLNLPEVAGLVYLPQQEVSRQFQDACRAVILCLLSV